MQASDAQDSQRSTPWLEVVLMLAVAAGTIVVCVPAFQLLSHLWSQSEFYGHAYAIPLVAGFLVYSKREELLAALRAPSPPQLGPVVVLLAATFEVVSVVGDVGFLAGLGIPLMLAASAFAIGGMAVLRPLLLPLGFLALMVPPPRFLTYELLFRLKLLVTDFSVRLLQLWGQPVVGDGNQILVPGHTLFVADACSGLTSIITLLPLSAIVAYFLSRGVWRRALVIASVAPLAVGANLVRVLVTVQLVSGYGIEYAQGILHESFGTATYVGGTLCLIGVARVLR